MTLKPLAMILTALMLGGQSCSLPETRNDSRTGCLEVLVKICRETYPGVFKLDTVGGCGAAGRAPEENEVPMSYCDACQEKQTAAIAAMSSLMTEGVKCTLDEECSLQYVRPAADFGCGGAFNEAFDAESYNRAADEWKSCSLAEAVRCQDSSSLVPPRCDKGRCTLSSR